MKDSGRVAGLSPWARPRFGATAGLAGLLLLSGCAYLSPDDSLARGRVKTILHSPRAPEHRLSGTELQARLMEFSDSYLESVTFGFDQLYARTTSTARRAGVMSNKVFYTSAATNIAADADPLKALLDMMLMLRLQRETWSLPRMTGQFGPEAAQVRDRLARLEAEIWKLGSEVLPPEAPPLLDELIRQWRRDNPEQTYVAFTRITHLPESPEKERLKQTLLPTFLLRPVSEAARSLDEARRSSERAVFVAERMPIFLVMHAQLAYLSIAAEPEMQGMLQSSRDLTGISRDFVAEFRALPTNLRQERRELLIELSERIAAEREKTLAAFSGVLGRERAAFFDDLDQQQLAWQASMGATADVLGSATQLLSQFEATTTHSLPLIQATLQVADRFNHLAEQFNQPNGVGAEDAAWTPDASLALIRELNRTTLELGLLLERIERMASGKGLAAGLRALDKTAAARVDAIFYRALILIGCLCVGLAGALAVPHLLSRGRREK